MAQLLEAPTVSLKHPVSSVKSVGGKAAQVALFAVAFALGIGAFNALIKPALSKVPYVGPLMGATPSGQAGGLFGGM